MEPNIGWEPIDTAPKDGSLVELTILTNEVADEIWPMRWMAIQRNGLFPGVVGMWTTSDGAITWNEAPENGGPTHWRPWRSSHVD